MPLTFIPFIFAAILNSNVRFLIRENSKSFRIHFAFAVIKILTV